MISNENKTKTQIIRHVLEVKKNCGYSSIELLAMLDKHRVTDAVKILLHKNGPLLGLQKFREYKLLHLSLEYLVLRPEWKHLFDKLDRDKAQENLNLVGANMDLLHILELRR